MNLNYYQLKISKGCVAMSLQNINNIDKFLDDIPQSLFNDLSLPINFVDRECRVVVMNRAFQEFLDVDLDNIIGTKLMDFDPSTRFPIILETGIPEINDIHRFKSGKTVMVDRIPIFDGDRVIGAAGMIIVDDMTPDSIDAQIRHSIINKIRPHAYIIDKSKSSEPKARYTFDNIITRSSLVKHFKTRARSFANTDLPVLITGESGVGKELFAHAIHNAGDRKDKPFVSINYAAIPDTLLESELFGYEAGSFTGASRTGKKGKFEAAHGGTIFLDEIGDLPPTMQSKLLRVLQENQIEKIGSPHSIDVDVRVIAATNHDLLAKIEEKGFRADLYYRINVLNLNIPSLKEHREDIPLLVEHFKSQYYMKNGVYKTVSSDAMNILYNYDWPGNIRELKNIVFRVMVLADKDEIDRDLIPENITKTQRKAYANAYDPSDLIGKSSLDAIMKEIESQIIEDTLKLCDNNKSKAADVLGIQRMTLYRKLKKE